MTELSARQIYEQLTRDVLNKPGRIVFSLANTSVTISTTDAVGNSIQSWLKQWMCDKGIYSAEPHNTQEFPDFFLSRNNPQSHMLEIKAFNYEATPAFDIANYESYVASVAEKPYRLYADYLVFGYTMDQHGTIVLKRIWLKKIWEIAGTSQRYALNTQIKRNVIYNIRPNSKFKKDLPGPFSNKEQFLVAIYETQKAYRGELAANGWKTKLKNAYREYYHMELVF